MTKNTVYFSEEDKAQIALGTKFLCYGCGTALIQKDKQLMTPKALERPLCYECWARERGHK